jgi:FtsP/CotA-like multicopper oxidase with cupredoxin domain
VWLFLFVLSLLPPIVANQNRTPAGVLNSGVLTIAIEAREGTWYPDSDQMPGIATYAFGEIGKPLQIPGPLIRVPAGTTVRMRVTNHIDGKTLRVAGLYDRPYVSGDTVFRVAPNQTQDIEFTLDSPGTYYYWGTANDSALTRRAGNDSQLVGAIVVDERGAAIRDRVFVITEWARQLRPGTNVPAPGTLLIHAINGKSWPHTERFKQNIGDTLNWKFINLSNVMHPMHLHGFYFRVDGLGDNRRDTTFTAADRRTAVTERLGLGGTMNVTWVPDRGGNWLFHCHVPAHVHPHGSLEGNAPAKHSRMMNHAMEGMAGLILGVEVSGSPVARTSKLPVRRLRLVASAANNSTPALPSYVFALDKPDATARSGIGATVNPVLVVRRGEPVAITVVNRLEEPTAVHWQGNELESYYDGVAGFGGAGKKIAPVIMPRDSFVARFIPPRAGTFIYHTHVDERMQQPAGLSGLLVVTEPGSPYDLRYDHPVLITTTRERELDNFYVNNSLQPPPMEWKVGEKHRFRVVNMMVAPPSGVTLRLLRDTTVMQWRTVAKDGMNLPETKSALRPAVLRATIGETHDVEVMPTEPGHYQLEVRLTAAPALRVRKIDIQVRE